MKLKTERNWKEGAGWALLPFRSEEGTERGEKIEVKVRGDKRFSSDEQNVNLCSDQRALHWSQEGKISCRRCEELLHLYHNHSLKVNHTYSLFYVIKIKERRKISGFLGFEKSLIKNTGLTVRSLVGSGISLMYWWSLQTSVTLVTGITGGG